MMKQSPFFSILIAKIEKKNELRERKRKSNAIKLALIAEMQPFLWKKTLQTVVGFRSPKCAL
jgi:hypothetical protein